MERGWLQSDTVHFYIHFPQDFIQRCSHLHNEPQHSLLPIFISCLTVQNLFSAPLLCQTQTTFVVVINEPCQPDLSQTVFTAVKTLR